MDKPVMGWVRERGLTLVELLVAVAVLAILLAVAVPAFSGMLHNSRLRGAADVMMADLRQAMTESIKRDGNISISFSQGASGWCYGYSVGAACDCHTANACVVDGVERVTRGSGYAGVLLTPGVSGNRFSFQPRRGTVTAGNVQFTASHGKAVRVVVSGYGRIRAWSPAGSTHLSSYPVC